MTLRTFAFLLAIAAAIAAFVALDLGHVLSLGFLKERHAALMALHAEHPLAMSAGFVMLFIAVTALSLPGGGILTLAGGAIFGWGWGLALVCLAASTGGVVAFLLARFVLRDWLERRFAARLAQIDEGIARDGAFYLLSLRLVPLMPFFIVNLLMGLTRMRVGTFCAVSLLGMLPVSAVIVNAGTQLARISSPADVLSPALLASFMALAVLPVAARHVMTHWKRRNVSAR